MNTKVSLQQILQNTPKTDLENLLIELAQTNEFIEKMIQIRFSPGGTESDKVRQEIRGIIDDCSDRYGFIDYRSSSTFERRMFNLIDNTFPRLIHEKNTKSAFEIICTFFFEFGDLAIDDSNGCLGSLMWEIMEHLESVIQLMTKEEKRSTFDWLEEHIDDEKIVDYIREDIFNAYSTYFFEKEFLKRKISYFDKYLEKYYSFENINDYHYSFELEKYAENRIACMEGLNCTEAEIISFCQKYENLPKLSNKLAEIYLSKKEYSKVEEIYFKIISKNEKNPGIIHDCKSKFINLYRITNENEKLKPLLKEFIFDYTDVNLDYYREYKAFFQKEDFEKELDSILKNARFSSQVQKILFEERKIEELFDYICKQHKDKDTRFSSVISSLDKYGKHFEPAHSAEVVQMYGECLDGQMSYASSRAMYAEVARQLKDLMKFTGGKDKAKELKEKWFIQYKNRPAMKDELNKVIK